MIALLKFLLIIVVMIGLIKAILYLCEIASTKFNVNNKVLINIVMFILFIVCSLLWSFTDVFELLSDIVGIPLEKG